MREVDFAKQKTEGEKSLFQSRLAPCQPPLGRGGLLIAFPLLLCYNICTKARNLDEKGAFCLPWEHLSQSYGGVCFEGYGEKGGDRRWV